MSGRTPHDLRSLSRQLVGHFATHVAACATLPGDALHGDITTITRVCLELTIDLLEGRDPADKVERLQRAAADWAREGIPIDTVHHAVHEGFRLSFDLLLNRTDPTDRPENPAQLLLRTLDTITPAVALAYVREHQAAVTEHHTAVHTWSRRCSPGTRPPRWPGRAASRSPPRTPFSRCMFRAIATSPTPTWTRRSSRAANFADYRRS
ncbi:hypothetical protein [Nocardia wallacei]|uniref:hypothetical protein n=1 Tax=Nocardia wallacei TaxID=480035 RepID=UPI00313BE879